MWIYTAQVIRCVRRVTCLHNSCSESGAKKCRPCTHLQVANSLIGKARWSWPNISFFLDRKFLAIDSPTPIKRWASVFPISLRERPLIWFMCVQMCACVWRTQSAWGRYWSLCVTSTTVLFSSLNSLRMPSCIRWSLRWISSAENGSSYNTQKNSCHT